MKIWLLTLLAAAVALPTVAATFTITDIVDPNGGITNSVSPFTSVLIPDGASGDGLLWTGVGAEIGNFGSYLDLGFFGSFECVSSGCSDQFTVDYVATGFLSGTTTNVALYGTGDAGFISAEAGNSSLGYVSANASSSFGTSSIPVLVGNPADFSGEFLISISMAGNSSVSLPTSSTADLVVTPGLQSGVPEPGTLAIVAACGLLLLYVKRLRKA